MYFEKYKVLYTMYIIYMSLDDDLLFPNPANKSSKSYFTVESHGKYVN